MHGTMTHKAGKLQPAQDDIQNGVPSGSGDPTFSDSIRASMRWVLEVLLREFSKQIFEI